MKRLVLALAALSLTALPACSTTKSNEGMASLHTNMATGSVTTTLPVNLDRAYSAAQSATNQMQYQITKQSKDTMTGVVNSKTADGVGIDVTVKGNGANSELTVNASPLHTDIAKNLATKIQQMAK